MAKLLKRKRKTAPKRVLRLPDLDLAKRTVLNSLGSPDSTRAYAYAIRHILHSARQPDARVVHQHIDGSRLLPHAVDGLAHRLLPVGVQLHGDDVGMLLHGGRVSHPRENTVTLAGEVKSGFQPDSRAASRDERCRHLETIARRLRPNGACLR